MTATTTSGQVVEVLQPLAVSGARAARLIGVSPRTWRRLDLAGDIPRPALRIGRLRRWSVAELTAWVAAGSPTRVRWEQMQHAELIHLDMQKQKRPQPGRALQEKRHDRLPRMVSPAAEVG